MQFYRVFVYGTLKRGFNLAWALDGQKFIGRAVTKPLYRMYNCGSYPALVISDDGFEIIGELWEVDLHGLTLLDEVEGISTGLYERGLVELKEPVGFEDVEAYFYCHAVDGFADVGRDWFSFLQPQISRLVGARDNTVPRSLSGLHFRSVFRSLGERLRRRLH